MFIDLVLFNLLEGEKAKLKAELLYSLICIV